MRLRMLTSIAGAGFSFGPGEETERFDAAEAMRLVAAGYAELVTEQPIERAVSNHAPERRAGRKKRHVVSGDN